MKLTIICSWCSVKIGEKDCDFQDESLPRITHSICQACSGKVLEDLEKSDFKKSDIEQPHSIQRR